jgi:hypothetical protein
VDGHAAKAQVAQRERDLACGVTRAREHLRAEQSEAKVQSAVSP